jgi:hypothetical protein
LFQLRRGFNDGLVRIAVKDNGVALPHLLYPVPFHGQVVLLELPPDLRQAVRLMANRTSRPMNQNE